MLETAILFGLPLSTQKCELFSQSEIADLVKHVPPYLVLTDALCGYRITDDSVIGDSQSGYPADIDACFVFAKACYSEIECDGHYPGCPSLPLTEIARSMDQSATLFAVYSGKIKDKNVPLLRRITKLKGGSIEKFDPDSSFWIWVSLQNGEITTKFYISGHQEPIVTISGWSYDVTEVMNVHSSFPLSVPSSDECEDAEFDREDIMKIIPQAPPFLILDCASVFQDEGGRSTIHSCAHVLPEMVEGHLGKNVILGPMHYSRALAQSGMVLCARVFGSSEFVPEVSSASGLWYDTGHYYEGMNTIRVEARITRFTDKRTIKIAVVSGDVYCCGRKVFGAESMNYIMIPRCQHPATIENN